MTNQLESDMAGDDLDKQLEDLLARPEKKHVSWQGCDWVFIFFSISLPFWHVQVYNYSWYIYMGVSKNRGVYPPKSFEFVHRVWNHYFHHPFWGVKSPYFRKHRLSKSIDSRALLAPLRRQSWQGETSMLVLGSIDENTSIKYEIKYGVYIL